MLKVKTSWQNLEVSLDQTHHVINQQPAYSTRFLSVLKFHEPGLAPVKDASGAFHINPLGEPIYLERFLQTFGFYEGRAAVEASSGWYHILTDGTELYQNRFAWCGNYQQGHCSVKDDQGAFFHINRKGRRAYAQTFQYAGDFHDGYAVIQNVDGLHTHIDFNGNLLHGKWFIDLDVYHKGFARAKDHKGWCHIDRQGLAIYPQRYKNIEPFYNGIARVETELGALYRITEKGKEIEILRKELEDEFHRVSGELVSYWRFYTLQAATELKIFDYLPNPVSKLSFLIDLPQTSTVKLLRALQEMGFVSITENNDWICTSKGLFLQSNHPYTLKNASRLWSEEHLSCWKNMIYSLKTGLPAFRKLFGKGWFDWLKDHPDKNQLYHEVLSVYARRDYRAFCSSIPLSKHHSLLDVGGSTGALLFEALSQNRHLQGALLDLPNVIRILNIPSHLKNRIECIAVDFFENWPSFQVESVVLSRILHDWSDLDALKILNKVYLAISNNPDNRLYIIEKVQEEESANGSLLDLHMLIMTGGVERTLKDFDRLLRNANFILEEIKPLNQVSSILVARKDFSTKVRL